MTQPDKRERRVLFVCTHNAGRSIVAAALLNAHQPPGVQADSAGTDPTDTLNSTVVTALAERGISLAGVAPQADHHRVAGRRRPGHHHEPTPYRPNPAPRRGPDPALAARIPRR